jgi:hypothetical protein
MDLLRGYAIEPKHLIPISAPGISSAPGIRSPSAVRLAISRVTPSYTCMKKSPRPFTFEVKRSRLTSRTPSTFQRYVVAPGGIEVQNVQEALAPKSIRVSDRPPLRSGGRILPSHLGEKVWVEEPVLPAPRLLSRLRRLRRGRSQRSSHLRPHSRWLNFQPIRPMRSRTDPNGPSALRDHLTNCLGASAGSGACRGLPGKSRNHNLMVRLEAGSKPAGDQNSSLGTANA